MGETMKNTINFYYNILADELIKKNDNYYFYFNGNEFYLIPLSRPYDDIEAINIDDYNAVKNYLN